MPFINLARRHFALPLGETRIGGTGDRALPFTELAGLPTVAVLFVTSDDVVSLWPLRGCAVPVTVNGSRLGATPQVLRHGTKIEMAGIRLLFGDLREAGTTTRVAVVAGEDFATLAANAPEEPTASTGGRLIAHATGDVIAVPDIGLVIGRDPDSDFVVLGREVSRRHAVVRPSIQGYLLSDISTNGTYVNGRRVDGVRVLGMGDVIQISDEEFRFEADPVALQPTVTLRVNETSALRVDGPTESLVLSASPEPATWPRPGANILLATLEVTNGGALTGTRFRLERPVVHIGRGSHNDVRLGDATVSGAHATLTRRGNRWIVLDHEATNGTYVEGERVAGAREFSGAVKLRFGGVEMAFHPVATPSEREADDGRAVADSPDGREHVLDAPEASEASDPGSGQSGILRRLSRLWRRLWRVRA
jgi:pSer/pThr/pTyr-binding forkhead associated (FHA) protein